MDYLVRQGVAGHGPNSVKLTVMKMPGNQFRSGTMKIDPRAKRYLDEIEAAHKFPDTRPEMPVVFRKHYNREWKEWSVTAFFPTLPSDGQSHYNMTCYAHIGQHSGASNMFYQEGKKAKPEEYADLLLEIRDIYENDDDLPVRLKVYSRIQPWMHNAREADWRRMRG